jgi:hypothetical protein
LGATDKDDGAGVVKSASQTQRTMRDVSALSDALLGGFQQTAERRR